MSVFSYIMCYGHLKNIFTKDDGCGAGDVTVWLEAAAVLSGAEAEAPVS